MTTLATQNRLDLIGLFIGFFNAAPGAIHLGDLAKLLNAGQSAAQIANVLAARPEFASVYSPALSDQSFAAAMAANLLGSEVSAPTSTWATGWVQSMLSTGSERQDVILAALRALKATSNPDFANARLALLNKVDVAAYYSMTAEMSAASLAELQQVLRLVGSDPASVLKAKLLIDSATFDPAGFSLTLTDGRDLLVGSTENDFIIASAAGALSSGDSIDGGSGFDVINMHAIDSIRLPTDITVRQVEAANITAFGGISGDVRAWDALSSLSIRSNAGDVLVTAAASTSVSIVLRGDSSTITNTVIPVVVEVRGGNAINITSDATVLPTIVDARAGTTLGFGLVKAIALSPLPLVNAANASLQQMLDAAAAGDGSATLQVGWFVYEGNTYVVADNSATATYVSGTDAMIKLVGVVDVGSATVNATPGKAASFTLA